MISLPLCVSQWFVILLTVLTTAIGAYNLVVGFKDESVTVEMVFGDEGISGSGPKMPSRADKYRTNSNNDNQAESRGLPHPNTARTEADQKAMHQKTMESVAVGDQ